MAGGNGYTQAQKNQIFASLTRQLQIKLPSFAVTESGSYGFSIPQNKYLAKIWLDFEGTFTVTHASETSWTAKRFSPYRWLTNVSIDINNGFSPFKTSGIGAYLFNLLNNSGNDAYNAVATSSSTRAMNILTAVASSGGTSNTIKFRLPLSLVINDRDPVGLINAQDSTTNIDVSFDTGTLLSLFATATGFTTSSISVTCTPSVEYYSIPLNPISDNKYEHLVDLNIIKLVQQEQRTVSSTGEEIIKLPRGTTYRRIIIDAHSSDTGLTDAQITNFAITLNTADTIYNLTGKQLQAISQERYGTALPAGIWCFDFTYQGFGNYGGSRDYIDTQSLNEFWLKCQMGTTGTLNVYYEHLAKMG